MKRGFTVVEVLVTMVVIAILLGLGTVGLRSTLANARDAERKADIETLARGFEQYYNRGNPYFITGTTKGSYPGTNMLISFDGSGWCDTAYFKNAAAAANYSICRWYWTDVLPGVTVQAMTPPGKGGPSVYNPWLQSEASPVTIMMPSIAQKLDEGFYVYKPLNDDNDGLCYSDTSCRRFALLYKKETTGEIVIVRSKHQ